MGLFGDLFKKKEEEKEYDPMNVRVTHLNKGFVFEYDLQSWVVKEVYEYDLGDGHFVYEYKIDNGTDQCYLSVDEQADDLVLTMVKKIKVRALDEDLPEYIIDNEAPPKKIVYDGVTYLLGNEIPCYFRNIDHGPDDWAELISWDYSDKDDKLYLCIEQWGEKEFDASIGKYVKEFQISNIVPR